MKFLSVFFVAILFFSFKINAQQPGDLDSAFSVDGITTVGFGPSYDEGRSVAIQSDGKIVVAGYSNNGSDYDFAVARFNSDGSLDSAFSSDGKVTVFFSGSVNDFGRAVAIQSDGKIVVAGYSNVAGNDFAVTRFNNDGSLDSTFSSDGKVTTAIGSSTDEGMSVAIQPDGKIVVAGFSFNGSNNDFAIARYNSDGSLDTNFSSDGKATTAIGSSDDEGLSVAVQSDGKIVVAGFSYNGSNNDFATVRYNSDGSLDNTFSSDGKVTTAIGSSTDNGNSVVIQTDGKIIIAGYSLIGSFTDFAAVRYNSDGNLDSTFSADGKLTTAIGSANDVGNSVVIQYNGKIVIGGYSYNGSYADFAVARYNGNGGLDSTFSSDGKVTTDIGTYNDNGNSIAIQSDGNILLAGSVAYPPDGYFGITRYIGICYSNLNQTITLCNGESVTVGAHTYSAAGTYYDTLTAYSGCDSIITTTLTINPVYSTVDTTVAICDGDSVLLYGAYRKTAGIYYDSLFTVNGCDSVFITTLTVASVAITLNVIEPSCNGYCNGEATASGSGGTPPYSYLWEEGSTTTAINGLCPVTYGITVTDSNSCIVTDSVSVGQPEMLTASVAVTNTSCQGTCDGKLTANPSGGTAPYSYLWDNSETTSIITGLCVFESHYVTVTDNHGCAVWESGMVLEPAALNLSTPFTDISCFGSCDATATASATGGTPPYSYLWTGGITDSTTTGLCPGLVEVTVTDANGCTAPGSLFFIEPSQLSSNAAGSDAVCAGVCNGFGYPNAYDGTAPYIYLWSNTTTDEVATGLCPGIYYVTITDSKGCSIDTSVTVSVQYTFTATLNFNNISCNGICDGAADAIPDNGTWPFTYLWNTNATTQSIYGLCNGTYSVTVSDVNGCTVELSDTIAEPPAIITSVAAFNSTCAFFCNGTLTVSTSGGVPGYSFYWDNGSIDSIANNLCTGTYNVTVTDMIGCTAVNSGDITEPLPVDGFVSWTDATCPGVCDGSASATISGGTPPYSYFWSDGSTVSSITSLCAGYYFLDVFDSAGCGFNTGFDIFDMNSMSVNIDNIVPPSACLASDGEIYISVFNGSGNYSYDWQPGGFTTEDIAGLAAGVYSVTVTDTNSCSVTATAAIPSPVTISVVIDSVKNIFCTGGSNGAVYISANGGTPPYDYLWSNGGSQAAVTGLSAGGYSVTVTDNVGCSQMASASVSEPGFWSQQADFIGASTLLATGFSIGNKGYVGTGYTDPTGFWEYDPATDSWSQLADFTGTGRYGAVGFSIGTNGYIGTGTDGGFSFSDFYKYDPSLNSWSQISDLPSFGRYAAFGFSIGNKAYVGTGYDDNNFFMDFWEYDAGIDNWTQKSDFPAGERYGAVGFSIGTKGYAGTGNAYGFYYQDFLEYEPSNDSWTQKALFPGNPRYGAAGFSLNSKGYLGIGTDGSSYSDFWEYNPSGDSWVQRADFSGGAREGAVAFSIGNSGYLGTGTTGFTTFYNDWWEFNPGPQSPLIDSVITIPATCNNCPDGSANVYAGSGTPPYTYVWSNGTTASSISNQAPDTLTVTVIDASGCDVSGSVIIDFLVSDMTFNGNENKFTVYPNPNNGNFVLSVNSVPSRVYVLKVFDILGKAVMVKTIGTLPDSKFLYSMDADLPGGVYSVKLESEGSAVGFQRIIVVK